MNNTPKYEYYVYTWGGFYNDHNKAVHGFTEGARWFDTKEEREAYINKLDQACEALKTFDNVLVKRTAEGYHTRIVPTCHRVIEHEGKTYYTKSTWSWPTTESCLKYHMEYKWYPGFNDEPLGEDFDYSKVKVIQEWITGAFDVKEEE